MFFPSLTLFGVSPLDFLGQAERWESKKAVLKLEVNRAPCLSPEPKSCSNISVQVSVLKRMQGCPHVCKYLHCGHFEEHNYLVMELLGQSRASHATLSFIHSHNQHPCQA